MSEIITQNYVDDPVKAEFAAYAVRDRIDRVLEIKGLRLMYTDFLNEHLEEARKPLRVQDLHEENELERRCKRNLNTAFHYANSERWQRVKLDRALDMALSCYETNETNN